MLMSKLKYFDLTQKIIDCAMKVYNQLGNGFQEVIYQRALAIEMREAGINFMREPSIKIQYKDYEIGTRRADFIVEDKILVELKAITNLEEVHFAQAINYLEAYNLEVCLLINFGSKRLEFKRFVHSPSAKPDYADIK